MFMTNIIADYISLVETNLLMNKLSNNIFTNIIVVLVDALLTFIIFLLILLITFLIISLSVGRNDTALLDFLYFISDIFGVLETNYLFFGINIYSDGIFLFSPLITTFITSFWIWAAVLGSALIRLMSLSRPLMRFMPYALPVDEKPIRSVGVAASTFVFTGTLIYQATSSVIT